MVGGQGEDSCGNSETDETPQERSDEEAHRPPAESEALHGNQQRSEQAVQIMHPNCLSLSWNSFRSVPSSFFFHQ
ncbi:hypothetical protein [Priestia megaterium]|uniref:hypothetical protein n=1 Tax=Priestia megaterium TaxID=1404 RepID=UPI002D80377E|nr:hypothetical protein [Priestia megaterium]